MRLVLPFPPPWQLKQGPDDRVLAILPGTEPTPALIVTYGPIVIKPDEPHRWLDLVQAELRPDTRLRVGRTLDHQTMAGWPVRFIEADVVSERGEVVEALVCAFYTFMEHGAVAVVHGPDRARLDAHGGKAMLAILEQGRPDWRGLPICLVDAWDLEPKRRPAARPAATTSTAGLEQSLAEVDAALAANPTAAGHVQRGLVLLALGRTQDAVAAFTTASTLDAKLAAAPYHLGVALGELGKHAAAIAAWQRALELAPDRADTHYNIAQARFLLEDYPAALSGFQRTAELDPDDLSVQRKLVQCFYALHRYDEGEAARTAFRKAWQASPDPRARLLTEYVFDQFKADGFWVHAIETLRSPHPALQSLIAFRAMRRNGQYDEPLGATVLIETSEQAKSASTPFVIGIRAGRTFRVIRALAELPAYPQLAKDAAGLLAEAVAQPPPQR